MQPLRDCAQTVNPAWRGAGPLVGHDNKQSKVNVQNLQDNRKNCQRKEKLELATQDTGHRHGDHDSKERQGEEERQDIMKHALDQLDQLDSSKRCLERQLEKVLHDAANHSHSSEEEDNGMARHL
mmetsp:Transcript_42082/g.101478  ORF Transcript_42082/g.101478 Transcript_42082/m.101478 type:complete len:125 (-) Transcript_42082:726-1100(-)